MTGRRAFLCSPKGSPQDYLREDFQLPLGPAAGSARAAQVILRRTLSPRAGTMWAGSTILSPSVSGSRASGHPHSSGEGTAWRLGNGDLRSVRPAPGGGSYGERTVVMAPAILASRAD